MKPKLPNTSSVRSIYDNTHINLRTITLYKRANKSYGLTIALDEVTGKYVVTKVVPNSIASKKDIQVGDIIYDINHCFLKGLPLENVMILLKESTLTLTLTMFRPNQPEVDKDDSPPEDLLSHKPEKYVQIADPAPAENKPKFCLIRRMSDLRKLKRKLDNLTTKITEAIVDETIETSDNMDDNNPSDFAHLNFSECSPRSDDNKVLKNYISTTEDPSSQTSSKSMEGSTPSPTSEQEFDYPQEVNLCSNLNKDLLFTHKIRVIPIKEMPLDSDETPRYLPKPKIQLITQQFSPVLSSSPESLPSVDHMTLEKIDVRKFLEKIACAKISARLKKYHSNVSLKDRLEYYNSL